MNKLQSARNSLMLIWALGSSPLFLVIFIQALYGKYGSSVSEMLVAYDWIITMIVPTLSVMIAAMTVNVKGSMVNNTINNPTLYWTSVIFSVLYFMCLYAVLFFEPFTEFSIQNLFTMTIRLLVPIQGIIAGLISKFFIENA